jgi:hypothetical protein
MPTTKATPRVKKEKTPKKRAKEEKALAERAPLDRAEEAEGLSAL